MRVFLFAILATFISAALALPPGTDEEIAARLVPNGSVCTVGADCGNAAAGGSAGGSAELSGEDVYNQFCFACHAAGVAGAPKFGDAAQWAPRVAKGMDTLWKHSIEGLAPGMPPRGTCMSCSDDDLHRALEYMVNAAQ